MLQMDGDSSTTDASQLGITGEYMASGHYVLQSQEGEGHQKSREQVELSGLWLDWQEACLLCADDAEESLNDHDDGSIKENFREQDIYLPIANVARIMKNAVPQTGKVRIAAPLSPSGLIYLNRSESGSFFLISDLPKLYFLKNC